MRWWSTQLVLVSRSHLTRRVARQQQLIFRVKSSRSSPFVPFRKEQGTQQRTLSNATTYTDYNIFVVMVWGEEVPVSQFLEHKVKQNAGNLRRSGQQQDLSQSWSAGTSNGSMCCQGVLQQHTYTPIVTPVTKVTLPTHHNLLRSRVQLHLIRSLNFKLDDGTQFLYKYSFL